MRAIYSGIRTEISENFRDRKVLRSKSREIAPKSVPHHGAKPAYDPLRSPTTMPSVGVLIASDSQRNSNRISPKFSKKCRGRKVLRSKSCEITPKSVPPGGAQLADDPQRFPTTVPSVGVLIASDSQRNSDRISPKFSKKFRGRKILRSKSCEIAPKSVPPGGAQLPHDPKRSPTTVLGVGVLIASDS